MSDAVRGHANPARGDVIWTFRGDVIWTFRGDVIWTFAGNDETV